VWFAKTRREEKENEEGYASFGESLSDINPIISFKNFLQRVIDDTTERFVLELREREKVELWENERFGGRFFVFAFINFHLLVVRFHRLRSCCSFCIPDRSERLHPSFRLCLFFFIPNLVILFFTVNCSSKRLELAESKERREKCVD
jgi:hypothetical protein